jgi:hypothetical protein
LQKVIRRLRFCRLRLTQPAETFTQLKFEKQGLYKFAGIQFVSRVLNIDIGKQTIDLSLKLRDGTFYHTHSSCAIDLERLKSIDVVLRASRVCEDDGILPKGVSRTAEYIEPDLYLSDGHNKQEVAISTRFNGAHLFLCSNGGKPGHELTYQMRDVLNSLIDDPPQGCGFIDVGENNKID